MCGGGGGLIGNILGGGGGGGGDGGAAQRELERVRKEQEMENKRIADEKAAKDAQVAELDAQRKRRAQESYLAEETNAPTVKSYLGAG